MSEMLITPLPLIPPHFDTSVITMPPKNYRNYIIGVVVFGIAAFVVISHNTIKKKNEK